MTKPWGGRSSFFCQFEYSIPVIEEVRIAVFYDIGFVNGDAFDFGTSKIVSDYGIGLRLNLPIVRWPWTTQFRFRKTMLLTAAANSSSILTIPINLTPPS